MKSSNVPRRWRTDELLMAGSLISAGGWNESASCIDSALGGAQVNPDLCREAPRGPCLRVVLQSEPQGERPHVELSSLLELGSPLSSLLELGAPLSPEVLISHSQQLCQSCHLQEKCAEYLALAPPPPVEVFRRRDLHPDPERPAPRP
uniref:Uncharacterized protein n=1 Tax=Knipowitschia caucasica TaxID=637954 RepID=A0AAV2LBJ7_KNICA